MELIPRALGITIFEIPDAAIREIPEASLPGNWKESLAPLSAKDFGSNLLTETVTLVVKIPSAVIHEEFNYAINPRHPGIGEIRILSVKDFVYDTRI